MNLSSVLVVVLVGVLGLLEARLTTPGNPSALSITTVLLAATMFGVFPGLFVMGIVVATLRAEGAGIWPPDTAAHLLVIGAAVAVCGGYTDLIRRQTRQTLTLRQAAIPLQAHASAFAEQAARTEVLAPREEMWRGLLSLGMVGSGTAAALLAGDALGLPLALGGLVASAVLVGGLLGARFGLFGGLIAWLGATHLIPASQDLAHSVLGLAVFGATGWGAGLLSDRQRQAQRALETMIAAGREMSATTREIDIRRGLVESLASLAPRSRVEVCDGEGPDLTRQPVGGGDWSPGDPRWRTRMISAAGRDLGVVRWRFPGTRRHVESLDAIAMSLVDLAASAIVRERLNVEKGDIELVARTEHLRTILLDAVAHHFRSPLAGILGSVTSILNLEPEHDRAVQRELLFIIKDQAKRLSRYVDNFLSVARLESGEVDVTPDEVYLEPLIYDVWEKFGEIGGARRFITADIDQSPLRTDPNLLGQALGNVLENAIKYSPEGSTVDVQARRAGGHCIIEISDEGPGVPPERISRIFERFYRSRSEAAPGLGLGLYITRSLVTILGGSVEAVNRGDGRSGLLVTIALPAAGDAA